jgi:hypothetical protein
METSIEVAVANEGNSREPLALALSLPKGWSARADPPATVPPGGRGTLRVAISPPAGANGTTSAEMALQQGNATDRARVLLTPVAPDLRLARVVSDAPSGRTILVSVLVENAGAVDVQNVTVALVADGVRLDTAHLQTLPQNATRIASLRGTPLDAPRSVQVVLDPDGLIPGGPAGRALDVATAGGKLAPGAPAVAAIAISLLLAGRRRRP